eukprot:CAMPEP_0116966936 /NCGR_PEP_ID=MMETSP0467-20121206/50209_1 /TAXON_ID=283647 /ORGANISM="Mesodinium pulex, Strain SPMC105" /LENGTH=134 /DNA_ID=CAMNT_0004656663 /DNA_START=312 /DNA_END=716 /DNA_ORIENTATION=-
MFAVIKTDEVRLIRNLQVVIVAFILVPMGVVNLIVQDGFLIGGAMLAASVLVYISTYFVYRQLKPTKYKDLLKILNRHSITLTVSKYKHRALEMVTFDKDMANICDRCCTTGTYDTEDNEAHRSIFNISYLTIE